MFKGHAGKFLAVSKKRESYVFIRESCVFIRESCVFIRESLLTFLIYQHEKTPLLARFGTAIQGFLGFKTKSWHAIFYVF